MLGKLHLLSLLSLCLTNVANSQSTSTLMGARAAGMGYAHTALADEWSFFNNMAGLGKVKQPAAAFGYEVRPALIGANRMATAFIAPIQVGTFGFGIHRFGDNLYSEQLASIAYGHALGNTSLGLRINYIQYLGEGFGKQTGITIDFGGITQLTQKISVGASIRNMTQTTLRKSNDERLPTRLTFGFIFKPDEKITIATELEKDIDFDPTWRTGIEYAVYKKVFFRSGYNLRPSALFFGTGIHKKNIKIDYAIQFTERQGVVHQISAVYSISSQGKK